ncbi:hypothetical protein [Povalibacter sp.]|uniref:hypothetical protein n=1 Tax=Povalibacter sp. TaxID=1962978 RepID=UPI002F41B027
MLSRIVTLSLVLAAGATHAGTVIEMLSRDLGGKSAETLMTTHAQNGQLRIQSSDKEGFSLFKDDALTIVNTRDRNYVVMDRAALQKMADAISPAMKMLARMPPEQRAQVEKLLGGKAAGLSGSSQQEVRKTARSDQAAGHSCNYVEILKNGVIEDELCVVAPNTLKGGDELMAAAQKMSAMLQDAFKDLDAPQLKQMIDDQTALYARVGGIPVLSRHYTDGKPVTETTLKSNRSETIPASTFNVPEGYTRKDFMPGR